MYGLSDHERHPLDAVQGRPARLLAVLDRIPDMIEHMFVSGGSARTLRRCDWPRSPCAPGCWRLRAADATGARSADRHARRGGDRRAAGLRAPVAGLGRARRPGADGVPQRLSTPSRARPRDADHAERRAVVSSQPPGPAERAARLDPGRRRPPPSRRQPDRRAPRRAHGSRCSVSPTRRCCSERPSRSARRTPRRRWDATSTCSGSFTPNDPFFGPFALETSAYSRLSDWPGGGIVGIHGTSQPGLIGQAVSHGCIRMRNEDVVRLRRLAAVGTPVDIVPSELARSR